MADVVLVNSVPYKGAVDSRYSRYVSFVSGLEFRPLNVVLSNQPNLTDELLSAMSDHSVVYATDPTRDQPPTFHEDIFNQILDTVDFSTQIVFPTYSEGLVLALTLAVVENKIGIGDVRFLGIQDNGEVLSYHYDLNGVISPNFPKEFLGDKLGQARRIAQARLRGVKYL